MLIGELVRTTGVPRDTVRYYEKTGLIPRPVRRANGYKEYGDETMIRLRFIRKMQELGFTLREIHDFFDLYESGEVSCKAVGPKVSGKLRDIDARIEQLQTFRKNLEGFFAPCACADHKRPCQPITQLLRL